MKRLLIALALVVSFQAHATAIYQHEGSCSVAQNRDCDNLPVPNTLSELKLAETYTPGTVTSRFQDFVSFTITFQGEDRVLLPEQVIIDEGDEGWSGFLFDPSENRLRICCTESTNPNVSITPRTVSTRPEIETYFEYRVGPPPLRAEGWGGPISLVSAVPEPGTLGMMGAGLFALGVMRRKRAA